MKIKTLSLYNFVVEASISRFDSTKTKKIIEIINYNLEDFVKHMNDSLFQEKGYFIHFIENSNNDSLNKLMFSMTESEYTVKTHKTIVYLIFQYLKKFDI